MGMARFGRSGGEGSGVEWTGLARRILAGMEKPVKARGMEGSGTVGIVEARQDRRGMARPVAVGLDTETQARCVKVARRKVMQGELRSGRRRTLRCGQIW